MEIWSTRNCEKCGGREKVWPYWIGGMGKPNAPTHRRFLCKKCFPAERDKFFAVKFVGAKVRTKKKGGMHDSKKGAK